MEKSNFFQEREEELAISAILVSFLLGFTILWTNLDFLSIIFQPEKLAEILGPYGPIGIIAGQFIQVVIAPIPPVIPVASGLLYGPWYGMVLSVIGATLGSILAIFISRRYGRPLVERFVRDSVMERFDSFTEKTGYTPFIVLFIFPGFPDDALCFIAGLTKLDWKNLAIIASLGRIPGILMLTTTGHSIAEANLILFLIASSSVAVVSTLSVKYRENLEELLRNFRNRTSL